MSFSEGTGGDKVGWAKFRGGIPILPKMPKMLKMARNGPKTNNKGLNFLFALRAKKLRGYLKTLEREYNLSPPLIFSRGGIEKIKL